MAAAINWHVAIQTCPRPGAPTLPATVASLSAAGWPADSVEIYIDLKRSGCWQAWQRMLAGVVNSIEQIPSPPAGNSKNTWILLAEDDAEFSANLRSLLDSPSVRLDTSAVYSLYCAAGLPFDLEFGWRRVPAPLKSWGSLAYLFHASIAHRLIDFLPRHPLRNARDGTDRAIGIFCQRAGIPYVVHSPSFVRHLGVQSLGAATSLDESGGMECNRQCSQWVKKVQIDEEAGKFEFEVVRGDAGGMAGAAGADAPAACGE